MEKVMAMAKREKMKVYRFTVLVEQDEDGVYIARVPSLQGCHTFAEQWEELPERVKEAIELCLEVQEEQRVASDGTLVGAFQMEVAR